MIFLSESINYTTFTQAGAVGLCLFALIVMMVFGKAVLGMLSAHMTHLNDETEKHTGLLSKLVAGNDRQHEQLRDISVTLVSTASAAQAAAAAAAAVAAAQAAIMSNVEQRAMTTASALATKHQAEREEDKAEVKEAVREVEKGASC